MTNPIVEALALKIHTASLPSLTLDEARVIAQSAFDTTTAAQVGEHDQYTKQLLKQIEGLEDKCDKYCEALANENTTTIERCAQVAESINDAHGQIFSNTIAAAIRKLKDVS